jgi:hypothetical protein
MEDRRWWQSFLAHPAWTGAGVIVTAAIAVTTFFIASNDGADNGVHTGPPDNLLEQIEQSDVWAEPPQVFANSAEAMHIPGTIGWPVAGLTGAGNVIALTPEELADDAVTYDGIPLYLVGRVTDERALTGEFDLVNEFEIVDPTGSVAYVGSGAFLDPEGEMMYALGRVAAVGETTLPSGRTTEAVYFLALNPATGVDFDTDVFELDDVGLSRSIRDAARRSTQGER